MDKQTEPLAVNLENSFLSNFLLKLSNFISYAFHPIFYFFYLNVSYWFLFPYQQANIDIRGILLVLAVIFFNTALLPILIIIRSKKSLVSGNLQERRFSILVTAVIYTTTYFLLGKKVLVNPMDDILIATIVGLCFAFIGNIFIKISLHASGVAGLVAIMLYQLSQWHGNYIYALIITVLLAGLVGSARLYLNAHTPKELLLGYISGFFVTLFVLNYYL